MATYDASNAFTSLIASNICQALSSGKVSSISAPAGFVAPQPQKYTVTEGQLGRVLHSAVPLVVRLGTGALMNGWTPSLAPDDGEGYSVVRAFGKKVVETGTLGPRPAQAVEVFEYEGSPYCRKVREAAAVLDLARGFSRTSTRPTLDLLLLFRASE